MSALNLNLDMIGIEDYFIQLSQTAAYLDDLDTILDFLDLDPDPNLGLGYRIKSQSFTKILSKIGAVNQAQADEINTLTHQWCRFKLRVEG
jgi:hypothetical protein